MRTIDHDVKIIAPIATLLAFPGNEHNFRPAHGAQRGGSVRPSRRRPDRRPRSFRGEYIARTGTRCAWPHGPAGCWLLAQEGS
ncbi:hypothetical protein VTN96DRAFT_3524 [Rasamsonia emersonii]